jgi:diguanylate cyclase (GGDEF)-like protein/PAS domain S-box-containing protein
MTPPKKTNTTANIVPPIGRQKVVPSSGKHPAHQADPATQAAHNLQASEVRYRRLFETAKDGILILDGDTGRITDANPFLQDMLGYSKDELIGKALWEIGPIKDIPASLEAMRHLQDSDYIRYDDLPLETRSGERKQVEFVSNVYLVDGWRVIQCNIRDITARKHAETRVNTATDELLTLVKELQWRDQQMQLMNHMNELLQSCVTQEEAYRVISLSAGDLFPGHNGSLAILSTQDRSLEVVARWGTEEIVEATFSQENCWALRRGQFHEVSDPQGGLMCRHFFHPPQHGYFCLPLIAAGKMLGVLSLIDNDKSEPGQHPHGLKQLAVTVGETIKLSLTNLELRDELRQQSIHDPLTGLFNRRYLDEVLPRELDVAQRRNASLCVVMLDIDGFKQFNDRLGHGAGDALLREFSQMMRNHLRKSDIVCRYGGDEFVIIMPDSSIHDTQERIERIRVLLKGLPKISSSEKIPDIISLSAGMAFMPDHGNTESELLRAADKAMYIAKKSGRDQVVVYQPDQSTRVP